MPPQCSCVKHDEYCDGRQYQVFKLSARKIRKNIVRALNENGVLSERALYLCVGCANYAENNIISQNESDQTKKQRTLGFEVSDVVEAIISGALQKSQLIDISRALGKSQSDSVFQDSVSRNVDYKNDQFLQTFKPSKWLGERNEVVMEFLKGVTNYSDDSIGVNNKKTVGLMKCVEEIYYVRNLNFISPLSFSANLLTYFFTGSKTVCSLNSCISPSSSYTAILKWLKAHSANAAPSPPDSDVISFFDNNQILARNWRVRFDAKALLSVITTVVHLIPDMDSSLQSLDDLSPNKWLKPYFEKSYLVDKFLDQDRELDELFRGYRLSFVNSRLNKICKQQGTNDGKVVDFVDREEFESIPKLNIQDQYDQVKDNHPKNPVNVVMGDPCLKNPCSYEAVESVMTDISNQCGVGENRKWAILGCDGLPYLLGSRLIDRTFKCPRCSNVLRGEDKAMQHLNDIHGENMDKAGLSDIKKFKNIFIVPGLGHIEINMVRTLFKLLWEPILIDLAKLLGFRSARALGCCQKAFDHHKSFQILEIFLFGTGDELLLPYCRTALDSEQTPTAEGFFTWLRSVNKPNYLFLVEVVFTYVLAVHLFRCAVRRNNHALIDAATSKFSALFYGLNCTQYQELVLRDRFVRQQFPEAVKTFVDNHRSLSQSGHTSKGEGGDFILEGKNKKIKQWLPPGPPTPERWVQICRNLDKLEKIRKNLNDILALDKHESALDNVREVDISVEIAQWRSKLRKSNYLDVPETATPHKTFSGKDLDTNLVSFSEKCISNKVSYYKNVKDGREMGKSVKLQRIFITPKDRKDYYDISKRSNDEIRMILESMIQQIRESDGEDEADRLETDYSIIKRKPKAELLNFYRDVVMVLEEVTGMERNVGENLL